MKDTLRPGLSRTARIVIDRDRTIAFMGEEGRVYATMNLVGDFEYTCRDLMLEHSDPGEDSVGIAIDITHTAPTLIGMTAEITVTVTAVEGRKVTFEVSARDDREPIGSGTHTRFAVDVGKTLARLAAKRATLAGG
jgi:predicted thioesterase